jgi:hypothetical protein
VLQWTWHRECQQSSSVRVEAVEAGLPQTGGLLGIDAGSEVALFQEVAPTGELIVLALPTFELMKALFCGSPATHHGDDSARNIRTSIKANDRKGGFGFFRHAKKCGVRNRIFAFEPKTKSFQTRNLRDGCPTAPSLPLQRIVQQIAFENGPDGL